jgi:hypothetical protein
MNILTGETADELFGGDAPPNVRALLQQAREAPAAEVPSLLWTAQACSPQTLAVYYLLAKCHATRRELDQAERAAQAGLLEAARQAGLSAEWGEVQLDAADFQALGPARFWLFMLKALAFIRTRAGRPDEARALLAKLAQLDPQASVGGDVVALLADAATLGQLPA